MTHPKPPDHRNAPFALWRRACVFVVGLVQRFGLPQQLAARRTLSFTHYKRILPWLRAGEALMRRLLLIEAALLKAPMQRTAGFRPIVSSPACGGSVSAQRAMTMGGGAQLDPENPASWRVSFRVLVSSPACRALDARTKQNRGGSVVAQRAMTMGGGDIPAQASAAPSVGFAATSPARGGGKALRFRAALPLARRLEALLRIYNNPAPFARRLAARLRRNATRITHIANDAWKKSRNLIGADLHDVLIAPIEEAQRLLMDSS